MWKIINTKIHFENEWVRVLEDQVRKDSGQVIQYTRIESSDIVSIIPKKEKIVNGKSV